MKKISILLFSLLFLGNFSVKAMDVVNNDLPFMSIKTLDDIQDFAGRIVAYKTSEKEGFGFSGYGYIFGHAESNSDGEIGFEFSRFVNASETHELPFFVTNDFICDVDLELRFLTKYELISMKQEYDQIKMGFENDLFLFARNQLIFEVNN